MGNLEDDKGSKDCGIWKESFITECSHHVNVSPLRGFIYGKYSTVQHIKLGLWGIPIEAVIGHCGRDWLDAHQRHFLFFLCTLPIHCPSLPVQPCNHSSWVGPALPRVRTASLFSFSFLLSDRFRGSIGGSQGLKGWLCHGRSSLESLVTKKSRISSPPTPTLFLLNHSELWYEPQANIYFVKTLRSWDCFTQQLSFPLPNRRNLWTCRKNKINTENYNTNWKVSYIYHVRDEEELLFLWENQGRFCQKRW